MDVAPFHHNHFPNPCLLLTVMATQFIRTFDKSLFKKTLDLVALRIPSRDCEKFR